MWSRQCILRNCVVTVFLSAVVLALAGCAYRLAPFNPASQELIRIVADAPQQYAVHVNTGTVGEYDVPRDGRNKVEIPYYRPSCGPYLFHAGKTLRKQSLRTTQKSSTEQAGYQLIRIGH